MKGIWKFKKLYCSVPEQLYEEIRELRLFSEIDSVVVEALERLVAERKGLENERSN